MKSVPPSGKETVDALANEWGKICAVVMAKLGHEHLVITGADIDAMGADGATERCIVVQELADGLHLRLMATKDAQALAAKHKGGFGRS